MAHVDGPRDDSREWPTVRCVAHVDGPRDDSREWPKVRCVAHVDGPRDPRLPRQFLALDADHDGMLTPGELLQYGDAQQALTPAFVNRLFEVTHTYEGRLCACRHRTEEGVAHM
eukprot:7385039-Prymnesium_polylepis.1